MTDEQQTNQPLTLSQALGEAFSHLRDLSTRDGIQSWDGNRWKNKDVIRVIKELNKLALEVKKLGVELPPVEVWGGGQVLQPAKFLYEDPFVNLENIHEAGPDLTLQCLNRGRQCYAFKPVSESIQKEAIEAAAKRGMRVFRIFDMMNSIPNIEVGIKAALECKKKYPDVRVEGAISYISEPDGKDGKRAWTLEEYGDYAVKLARLGCDEIAIKDYVGVVDHELPELLRAIRAQLDQAGFTEMKINLHSHGDKAELLAEAVNGSERSAGAKVDKVDVAIGELSGGPSHSNMRDVIYALLKDKFSKEEIDSQPVMQQLAQTEKVIEKIVKRKDLKSSQGKEESFYDRREVLRSYSKEDVNKYRLASGALSDLWSRVSAEYDQYKSSEQWKEMWETARDSSRKKYETEAALPIPLTKKDYFYLVLNEAPQLWEQAGRFNTVTPGSKILTDQALKIANAKIKGCPITIHDYTAEYMAVAAGRLGDNQGMDKHVGNVRWRDTTMALRALDAYNAEFNKIKSSLSSDELIRINNERSKIEELAKASVPFPITVNAGGTFNFPNQTNDLPATPEQDTTTPLKRFREAVHNSALPSQLKSAMLAELQLGRSQTPTAGIEEGEKILEEIKATQHINYGRLAAFGAPVSDRRTMALMAIILQDTKNGQPDNTIMTNFLEHQAKCFAWPQEGQPRYRGEAIKPQQNTTLAERVLADRTARDSSPQVN